MQRISVAALAASFGFLGTALPAYAGDGFSAGLSHGNATLTNPDGIKTKGSFTGIEGGYAITAETDLGLSISVGVKGAVDVFDLSDEHYSYAFVDLGDPYEVFQGNEVKGRARAALTLGIGYGGFELSAAFGYQAAQVAETFNIIGSTEAQSSYNRFTSYAAGQFNEFGARYTFDEFYVGVSHREGDLVISKSEFTSSSSEYGYELSDTSLEVGWRRRY